MCAHKTKTINKICLECGVEFESKYGIAVCCSRSCSNRYNSKLRKTTIDEATGLPVSKVYANRGAKRKHELGSYSKPEFLERANRAWKAMHTAQAKENSRRVRDQRMIPDESGITSYQRAARKTIETKIKRGKVTPLDQRPEYERYVFLVRYFSELNDLTLLEHHDKRGRAGVDGAYQLDHIYSIQAGFHNRVPPEVVGHIRNLRFIPWFDNGSKGNKCDVTIRGLFENTGYEFSSYYPDSYKEIYRSKGSADKMNNMRKICPHCGRTFSLGNYAKWHGDKCKHKPTLMVE